VQLARAVVAKAMDPTEVLVWAGRPAQGLRLIAADGVALALGMLWGSGAILWEVVAIRSNAPWWLWVWGLPFAAIGFNLVVGRFFVDAQRRARTFYGLTQTRALIVFVGRKQRVTAIDLASQHQLEWTQSADGRGSIHFGTAPAAPGAFQVAAGWGTSGRRPPAFELIEQPEDVYDRIRDAQQV
jgi:hypothetical protein